MLGTTWADGVSVPGLYHKQNGEIGCGFYFGDEQTIYKMGEKAKTIWTPESTSLVGTINFSKNEGDTNFSYKSAVGGYDLYVTN
jgi:hypothetical protein